MKRVSILIILMIFLFGCAYYNTFYNAEKFYKQARSKSVGSNGKPSSDAIQKYNKAIKKCGIILTDYKNSKYADDALFILAKSLYYKGRNYIQAIEKFEDLIKYYPKSEFLPDAELFIIKANYKLNNKDKVYSDLLNYVSDPEMKENHSQAYFLLAKYHLADKDYSAAEQYFQKIIDKFPNSDEFENAYFLLGKTYHDAENYEKSNETFFGLLKAKVSRKVKMDARYYIAKNYLLLENFQKAYDFTAKLIKDEYRVQKISQIKLLIARSLAGLGKTDEAIDIFNAIISDNVRTAISAEAAFYAGEMYFDILHNYEKAIEYYNKVQTEYRNSEFVQQALSKSSIASQIIQYYNPNSEIATEELVNQQFKLAEFYFETLSLPDSAMVVYDKILARKKILAQKLDSLSVFKDSLVAVLDTMSFADSTFADPIFTDSTFADSTFTDSSQTKYPLPDSVATEDSTAVVSAPVDKKTQFQTELQNVEDKIETTKNDLTKFDEDIIPRIMFIRLWLYKNAYHDSLKTEEMYDNLQKNYPENKYFYAAKMLMNDEQVSLTTAENVKEAESYREAIQFLDSQPKIAVEKLKPIAAEKDNPLALKANYGIGYIEYFMLADSITAKTYFDTVLARQPNSEFSTEIGKFYNGISFLKLNRLPYIEELQKEETEAKKKQEEEKLKENNSEAIPDTLLPQTTPPINIDKNQDGLQPPNPKGE